MTSLIICCLVWYLYSALECKLGRAGPALSGFPRITRAWNSAWSTASEQHVFVEWRSSTYWLGRLPEVTLPWQRRQRQKESKTEGQREKEREWGLTSFELPYLTVSVPAHTETYWGINPAKCSTNQTTSILVHLLTLFNDNNNFN